MAQLSFFSLPEIQPEINRWWGSDTIFPHIISLKEQIVPSQTSIIHALLKENLQSKRKMRSKSKIKKENICPNKMSLLLFKCKITHKIYREHLNVLMEGRNFLSNKLAEHISIYCHYLEGNGTILVDNLQNEQ